MLIPFLYAGLIFLGLWSESSAIPAFARRYEVSCRVCHANAYPRLNLFGLLFKENGYQYPEGAEDPVRAKKMVEPGTIVEKLALFREPPLSVRIQHQFVINQNPDTAQSLAQNSTEFKFPTDAALVGGGSLYKNVSALFSYTFAPAPDLHYMTLGVHNIGGNGVLNVRAGKFMLFDFVRPDHRRWTALPNLSAQVAVGKNPFQLDQHHIGIDTWGRPQAGPLFWELALVNGAQAHGGPDGDNFRDAYGRLTYSLGGSHTVGLLAYRGKAILQSAGGGITRRFEDDFTLGGADFELTLGPLTPFFHFIASRHGDPLGSGESVDYYSYRGTLDWFIAFHLIGTLEYHQVISRDDRNLELRQGAVQLTHLILANAKGGIEYQANFDAFDRSRVLLLMEAAF